VNKLDVDLEAKESPAGFNNCNSHVGFQLLYDDTNSRACFSNSGWF